MTPSLKPLNCKSHLTDMLASNTVSKWDKRAIRFALHVMDNSWYRPKSIAHKDFPFWRMVKYTDDGCSFYQCLNGNCKKQWEAREAPGWYETMEECSEEDSTLQYAQNRVMTFHRKRERPIYHSTWQYCPHCCIEWHGPIRTDDDNERMLGPRRKRIQDAVNRYHETHTYSNYPSFYWVIEKQSPCSGTWLSVTKFTGSAVDALRRLKGQHGKLANYKYRLRIYDTKTTENREALKYIY